jgi:ATPase subunit of ABC transporter with duplicated ATPase domains
MPASIILSNLSWSTPDGRPLLSNLDLSFGAERTGLVGRNGVGKSTLLKLIAGELQPPSGAVSFGGSLGILRQSVQVEPDETVADLFQVTGALAVLRRAEAGEATAEELASADWTLETRIASALDRAGLDAAPETLLAALSGGQRTRAGLAALIFTDPDFLILDEPTNNLDREGREAVIELLANWRAGAIVVSHDRELLDTVDAIVEMTRSAPRAMAATGADIASARPWSLRLPNTILPMPRSALPRLPAARRQRWNGRREGMVPAKGRPPRAAYRASCWAG